MPYDCKQYDFCSETLKLPHILHIPAFWASTNLEMIQKLNKGKVMKKESG